MGKLPSVPKEENLWGSRMKRRRRRIGKFGSFGAKQARKQALCMPNRQGKHVEDAATGEELTRTDRWPRKIQGWFLLLISNTKSSKEFAHKITDKINRGSVFWRIGPALILERVTLSSATCYFNQNQVPIINNK